MTSHRLWPKRLGFTLVELLVVIAIIAVLAGILLPSLARARNLANRTYCLSQLRQIAAATRMYADVYKGLLPGPHGITDPPSSQAYSVERGTLWTAGILKEKRVWLCPVDPRKSQDLQYSYTYNGRMILKPGREEVPVFDPATNDIAQGIPREYRRITSFRRPSQCIIYGEENTRGTLSNILINDAYFTNIDITDNRHLGYSAVGYLDGHADIIPPKIMLFFDKKWGYCY